MLGDAVMSNVNLLQCVQMQAFRDNNSVIAEKNMLV